MLIIPPLFLLYITLPSTLLTWSLTPISIFINHVLFSSFSQEKKKVYKAELLFTILFILSSTAEFVCIFIYHHVDGTWSSITVEICTLLPHLSTLEPEFSEDKLWFQTLYSCDPYHMYNPKLMQKNKENNNFPCHLR